MKQGDISTRRLVRCTKLVLVMTLVAATAVAAPPAHVPASDAALAAVARAVGLGHGLSVEGVLFDGDLATSTLDLVRFEVFEPDAILVTGEGTALPRPRNAYFRGTVSGEPGSQVVLTITPDGRMRGIARRGDEFWMLGQRPGSPGLANRKVDLERELDGHTFDCLTGDAQEIGGVEAAAAGGAVADAVAPPTAEAVINHSVEVAIETDEEYLFNVFGGDATAALDYIGDIIAYASATYEAEIDSNLVISYTRLWTQPGTDPYSSSNCSTMLSELRSTWNANQGGVHRDVVHMLSGKNTGCGIAYVGVVCNTSYGYGLTGGINGNFDIDNPRVLWDIEAVSHELGHNHNSPHTHNYCGIEGISDPVDRCYAASDLCLSPATGLPSCSDGRTSGEGTIMSYCHLVGGGWSNISFTFGGSVVEGTEFPCGVAPARVPRRMNAHVAAASCTDPVIVGPTLTVTKDGDGSGVVTSDDGGIDCGSDCAQTYPDGANPTVVLTAAADSGSELTGWSGSCTGTAATAQVVVDADKTCTATFVSLCGNGVLDPGEVCDGSLLNGESCDTRSCGGGTLACNGTCDGYDLSGCFDCACNFDGTCDGIEDCISCPSDCASGTTSGAVCGNGVCEAGNGEDCESCPADCNGVTKGKPSGRFCCGDGGGRNPILCDDGDGTVCNSDGWSCTATPTEPGSWCCGDATCDAAESCSVCALDCSVSGTEAVCDDGLDDDCNGFVDCDDVACSADPACQTPVCKGSKEACSSDGECCSNNCRSKGRWAGTCA